MPIFQISNLASPRKTARQPTSVNIVTTILAAVAGDVDVPRCPQCDASMRPGVVWFGEQLPWRKIERVENYLQRGACDYVIVAGTTATFGYVVDWALRAGRDGGELIEVNPEETSLSSFAT